MSDWQVQDAKARFSELLNLTLRNGPQVVTRRGVAAAVLVPIDEWRRLQETSRPSLKDLLLQAEPRSKALIPQRRRIQPRSPVKFS
jgi:antitoxin Phd